MRNRKKTRTARELEETIVGNERRISNGKEVETYGNKGELERNSNKNERKLETNSNYKWKVIRKEQ